MLRHDRGHKAIVKNMMLLSPVLLLLTGTGCGMAYAPVKGSASGSGTTYSVSDAGADGIANGAAASGAGGSTPYHIKFEGNGYDNRYAVTVKTGTTLKVRWISGKQNQQDNGQFYQYSGLGVFVGVGTHLQPTEFVHNGYGGIPAEQSSVIDLSGTFTTSCHPGDTQCRQDVQITVAQPNNDDDCLNHSYTACPWGHVPAGHSWNGTLVVQTDDTAPI